MDFSQYIDYTAAALQALDPKPIDRFIDQLVDTQKNGRRVFVIGNGGSAANASHLAQDLAKGTLDGSAELRPIRALALTDNTPWISALGNDEGYERIFVGQLRTFAESGDLLVAISGSGNSPNILEAVRFAKEHGLYTIGVTGFDGGALLPASDLSIHVALDDMCTSESIHSVLFHYVVLELTGRLKREGARLKESAR